MNGDLGDVTPHPDPTRLTTEQLHRELRVLRELLETRDQGLIDRLDHTWGLHKVDLIRVQEGIAALREVIFDKFSERDLRFHEKDASRQTAVEAALATSRELTDTKATAAQMAADKFQEAIVRQLETVARLNTESRERLADQIRALEQRMDRGEGTQTGAAGQRVDMRADAEFKAAEKAAAEYRQRANTTIIIAAIALLASIIIAALPHLH